MLLRRRTAEFNKASASETTGINARRANGQTLMHMAAAEGDVDYATRLLRRGANPNAFNAQGQTPLYDAITRRDTAMIELLFSKGATFRVADDAGRTPLMWAVEQGCDITFLDQLAKMGCDMKMQNDQGRTALHTAAEKNRSDLIGYFYLTGLDLNLTDNQGETPMHAAARGKAHDAMRALLVSGASGILRTKAIETPLHLAVSNGDEAGCDILLRDQSVRATVDDFKIFNTGHTPLMLAVRQNLMAIAQKLIALGADIELRDNDGSNCLFMAAELGHPAMVKMLIENGADVMNAPQVGYNKNSILHMLYVSGYDLILRYLVDAGANVNAVDYYKETPLHKLSSSSTVDKDKIRLLLEAGADPNQLDNYGRTAFARYIGAMGYADDAEVVKMFLNHGAKADLPPTNDAPYTVLHHAVMHGQTKIAKTLLEHGAALDVPSMNYSTVTPLLLAVEKGHVEIVKLLIGKGADVLKKDSYGRNALTLAASQSSKEVIEMMLAVPELKRDINVRDNSGYTALYEAARSVSFTAVELLIANGADPMIEDNYGANALHRVAMSNSAPLVNAMHKALGSNVDWNVKNSIDGQTPLHVAALRCWRSETIDALLKLGADITVKDNKGMSPFHSMASQSTLEILKAGIANMKEKGLHVDELLDNHKRTALHVAASSPSSLTSNVEHLLNEGADPNAVTAEGETPLHLAAAAGATGLIELLVARGADPEMVNAKGQTPEAIATTVNYTATAQAIARAVTAKKAKPASPKP